MTPMQIARLITEDIRYNNGLYQEAVRYDQGETWWEDEPNDQPPSDAEQYVMQYPELDVPRDKIKEPNPEDINEPDIPKRHSSGKPISPAEKAELLNKIKTKKRETPRDKEKEISLDKIIAIHMTNYFPVGGIIKTTGSSRKYDIKDVSKVDLTGLDHEDDYREISKKLGGKHVDIAPRETIHFTLNHPVASLGLSGGFANWSEKKVAILIPAAALEKRWVNLGSIDSWIMGSLQLPAGTDVIAKKSDVPEGENGGLPNNVKLIIVNDDANLYELVNKRIENRGFTLRGSGEHGWSDHYSNKLQKPDERISSTSHYGSSWNNIEDKITDAYKQLFFQQQGVRDRNNNGLSNDVLYKLREADKDIEKLRKIVREPEEIIGLQNIIKKYKAVESKSLGLHIKRLFQIIKDNFKEGYYNNIEEILQEIDNFINKYNIPNSDIYQKLTRKITIALDKVMLPK